MTLRHVFLRNPRPPGAPVVIYVTWHPRSIVTEMVLYQLAAYRLAGFYLSVVSNSERLDERLILHADIVVHRENVGHDWGAWKEAAVYLHGDPPPTLLLVNDSVCGPAYNLVRSLNRMVNRPADVVVGMTECRMYAAHLQSYCLMFRGPMVRDALHALAEMDLPNDKAGAIGLEIGLSQAFLSRGWQLGAEWGTAWTTSQADAAWLNAVRPPPLDRRSDPDQWTRDAALARWKEWPANPTHHLWLPLLRAGFPWIKRDLVLRNPGRVPEVANWRNHWPANAPVSADIVQAHLDSFQEQAA